MEDSSRRIGAARPTNQCCLRYDNKIAVIRKTGPWQYSRLKFDTRNPALTRILALRQGHWFADQGSGPGREQLGSVVWWYYPHIEEPTETNAGLLGPIIITAKGKARTANAREKRVRARQRFDSGLGSVSL